MSTTDEESDLKDENYAYNSASSEDFPILRVGKEKV